MKHPRLLAIAFVAVCLFAVVPIASPETDQVNTRTDYPFEWFLTPTDAPCLTETIYVSGLLVERLHVVFNPAGGYSYQVQQNVVKMIAVGLTTGETYQYNGPASFAEHGSTDQPWDNWQSLEWTYHNLNNYQGPGKLPNVYYRFLTHVTLDMTTQEVKVEVFKESLTCK